MPEGKQDSRMSRLFAEGSGLMTMPDVGCAEYLIEFMLEIGVTDKGLSWLDINEWSKATGIKISPWEAATIKGMAKSYLLQYNKSSKPECPAPYIDVKACREQVDKKIRSVFG